MQKRFWLVAVVVPLNSSLKAAADLKGRVVGLVASAEKIGGSAGTTSADRACADVLTGLAKVVR